MIYEITVQEQWFNAIINNNKTVEGRIDKGIHSQVKPGDIYIITNSNNTNQKINGIVKFVRHYQSFLDMLIFEGLLHVLPGINTVQKAVQIYHSFKEYKENEEIYGVVAIGL